MDYYEMVAELQRLIATGADTAAIENAAHNVAMAERGREMEGARQEREEAARSYRQRMQDGDHLKGSPELWSQKLATHLGTIFTTHEEVAQEACRVGGIDPDSPMGYLVKAVASAAHDVSNDYYDY